MNINCTCKYLFATANKTYLHLQIFNCKKQRLSGIEFTEEYLRELGLNERQIKAVMYIKLISNRAKKYPNDPKKSQKLTKMAIFIPTYRTYFGHIGQNGVKGAKMG